MTECQKQEAKSQSQLKVCGLTQLSQIRELVALKIDFLGFIYYEKSPRFVLNHLTLDDISKINHSGKVGVFVNEIIEKIVEISEKAGLSLIQLHGDENEDFILKLRESLNEKIQIIKVIRIGNQTIEELQNTINRQPTANNYLLFDTDSKAFGGTGNTFDWQILNQLKINKPYFLSGGISLENVDETNNLIQQPFALDVNSKFETEPGIKDVEKIKKLYEKL
ncbi:phosphoribosylanthranilate isomerase [Chryseobacterium aquaticum]|uniref:N-(5'-phosphoribosyl)anthranilate isomerase n=1 Tax=Chryseobacterium aquaticum TaxID=452084 RepID=A0A848N547_9FLAO|nr:MULTISPECIES: phosphoribosylanthranilate isomerase [Chryseobacterium]NMR34045.1 phosphoribosylanthranilate isomerase [Chryseobacterium aquaticum]NRQ46120.1 phosphoribosylanthranilate isomerase [Chryseobacterium sp. C-204]